MHRSVPLFDLAAFLRPDLAVAISRRSQTPSRSAVAMSGRHPPRFPGRTLYEGPAVKHLFHRLLHFSSLTVFIPVSLFGLKARFSAPAQISRAPARAGAVKIGRRSVSASFSAAARPYLYGVEHAGMLVGVGMMFEGSPLSGTRRARTATLYSVGPNRQRPDPNHDARMRIGGEAPRWWTHS